MNTICIHTVRYSPISNIHKGFRIDLLHRLFWHFGVLSLESTDLFLFAYFPQGIGLYLIESSRILALPKRFLHRLLSRLSIIHIIEIQSYNEEPSRSSRRCSVCIKQTLRWSIHHFFHVILSLSAVFPLGGLEIKLLFLVIFFILVLIWSIAFGWWSAWLSHYFLFGITTLFFLVFKIPTQ